MTELKCGICGEKDPNASRMELRHGCHNDCYNALVRDRATLLEAIMSKVVSSPPPGLEEQTRKFMQLTERLMAADRFPSQEVW